MEAGLVVRRQAGGRVARVRAASVQPGCGDAVLLLSPINVKILGREIAAELESRRSALPVANPQMPRSRPL